MLRNSVKEYPRHVKVAISRNICRNQDIDFKSMTIMVQREVAERFRLKLTQREREILFNEK